LQETAVEKVMKQFNTQMYLCVIKKPIPKRKQLIITSIQLEEKFFSWIA
jgi:hypothetical protein